MLAVRVAAKQLHSTCRRCSITALRFLGGVSSKKPDPPGSLKSAAAHGAGTQGARPRSASKSPASKRSTPQRTAQCTRVDPATFHKQVQLSKDLISMRHIRWREVMPRGLGLGLARARSRLPLQCVHMCSCYNSAWQCKAV
jgi:hypothetical protein